jgi:L-threonylcarbamoyladenylate synthase
MAEKENIARAARLIREGKLVAFPTDTVYGLGANALNPLAVARIFELKERPSFDPLIVHIASLDDLERLTPSRDVRIYKLAGRFWPGPLTMVLPKSGVVPGIVTSGLPTVGIRMPDNEIALELIRQSGCPIAGPSANKFGRVSPTTPQHVRKQLPDVDYILEGGTTKVGIESTIIALNDKGFHILRHGIITREEIEAVVPYFEAPAADDTVVAPGMLKSHYSPSKPLYFAGDARLASKDRSKAGLISFTATDTTGYQSIISVSKKKDLKEYAVNLFASIHIMEDSDVEYIVVEAVPEKGIGIAIMDRLKKAAFQYQGE